MNSFFAGKRIVVGVSGSIAAFKVAGWVSTMSKAEADLEVIVTAGGQQFVGTATFAGIIGREVHVDMFKTTGQSVMAHIDLGVDADLLLIAPASANTIARLANGAASDLLSSVALAARCPVVVCPAMNPGMYAHPATKKNIQTLKNYGYHVIEPGSGEVACKQKGQGRLAEWSEVVEEIAPYLCAQDLAGKQVLVTAGPTREPLDPARFLGNRSSGKMGYALARVARRRGAEVVLVSGPTALPAPAGVRCLRVNSANEMREAVLANFATADLVIKSAAVADFRPARYVEQKVKKEGATLSVDLARNPDILQEIGQKRQPGQILVGFAAESEDIIAHAEAKRVRKGVDLIAVNDISGSDRGFESDTNQLIVVGEKGHKTLPLVSKEQTANLLWDEIVRYAESL